MPSATTAESRDSIAPSSVSATAGRISPPSCCHSNVSARNGGSEPGTAPEPNRPPIVSTGRLHPWTTIVPSTTATIDPGTYRAQAFGQSAMSAIAPAPTATVGPLKVGSARDSADIFSKNSTGIAPSVRPRKSFTWVRAIVTAIPQVNPVVTGCGMWLRR